MKVSPADLDHVLTQSGDIWNDFRGARIFITGGTGFVGTWLLESLAHVNDRLHLGVVATVLTRDPARFAAAAPHLAARADLRFHQGDVRDFTFPQGECTHIVHAGTTSGAPVAPREMFSTICAGTARVLAFAAQSGHPRLLFVSSGAVYGAQPPDMLRVPEEYVGGPDPLQPNSAYGEGKRAGELLCALAAQADGANFSVARCFAFVGPRLPLDAHFAVGNFIRDALAGGPIKVGGDGTPIRSYLYAADLTIWLWTILLRGKPGRAYNVGSGDALSIAELAETVLTALDIKAPVEVAQTLPTPLRPPARYVPDVSRALEELGLRMRVQLPEGIRRTARWARQLR